MKAGDPLFALEPEPETAARDEADRRVAQARANLEDAKKGQRPTEIESLEAQLQARAAPGSRERRAIWSAPNASSTWAPGPRTMSTAPAPPATRTSARRQTRGGSQDRPARRRASDQIAAAEANVRALEAALAKAEWDLAAEAPGRAAGRSRSSTRSTAPANGSPRASPWWCCCRRRTSRCAPSCPRPRIGSIQPGRPRPRRGRRRARAARRARCSFISPRAEYTPPVIYSRESRGKLVFMIEIVFDPAVAATLHPGQPVDVLLGP